MNKRQRKKQNNKKLKVEFKNDFEIRKIHQYPKLTFRELMILYDYFTYNILLYADDSVKAQRNLKQIVDLRFQDMIVNNGG